MRKHESVGIAVPEILLPRGDIDLTKWAVVACDQFTSQPEYWDSVRKLVGSVPSTLNMIYPEVFLGEERPEERIESIRQAMNNYVDEGVLVPAEGLIYVEREAAGKLRRGLVVCIDLEKYDYTIGSESLVRATEGTILERIPPRVKIREGARLELPHIMILIDDPDDAVIGPLSDSKGRLDNLYDFELMMDSGRLQGFRVADIELEKGVVAALENLADKDNFIRKYDLPADTPVLLFAMGDGNHSLATAKAIWERTKKKAGDGAMSNPARYALAEVVNLHDPALRFEPIHRVIFGIKEGRDPLREMNIHYAGRYKLVRAASLEEMQATLDSHEGGPHKIGVISPQGFGTVEIANPDSNLPAGSLQLFLDRFMREEGAQEIDYIHGTEPVAELGARTGNIGFYLPAMDKQELFRTVILDGALPRKTFSMGEAAEKRFYMECRKIS